MQWEHTRRRALRAGALGLTGLLAGCPGDGGESTATDEETETATETAMDTETATETGPPKSVTQVGAGSYATERPDQYEGPPSEAYVTDDVNGPLPTNTWFTDVAWAEFPTNLWSHPLVVDPGFLSLNVGAPQEWTMGDGPPGGNVASLPAEFDLSITHDGLEEFDDSVLAGWGDWSVDYRLRGDGGHVDVTQVQGSPYLFLSFEGGNPVISVGEESSVWADQGNVLGITVGGRHYGIYAETGATWSGLDSDELSGDLGDDGRVTVTALPSADESILEEFGAYALDRVTDTRIDWTYDAEAGEVRTTYTFETTGDDRTIAGLYPHQYNYADLDLLEYSYVSPRGELRTFEGSSYEIVQPYQGVLPNLPSVGEYDEETMNEYLEEGIRRAEMEPGPEDPSDGAYWTGKNYFRNAELVPIAEQFGETDGVEALLEAIRTELSGWFTASSGSMLTINDLFVYDETWGTLIAYPAGFGAPADLNDHHFHYGYFVRAAAEIARHDPEWASEEQYGGMADLVIRDYANPTRDHDMFPFLRNFSPYSGHSFAGGTHGAFDTGNNQESSSEAIHAYAAMIMWGEYTGDEELRDTGIFLYTQETIAAREYWFDERGENLPDVEGWEWEYACQVWGNGVAWTTWWTDEVEAIYLINALPVGGHSLYLGLDDEHAGTTYDEMLEYDESDYDYYPGIAAKYRSFSDPDDARTQWESIRDEYTVGLGETRARTEHWIESMGALGSPDPDVTADHPLAAAFERDGTRTYVAYNDDDSATTVTFSDGTELDVPAGEMATTTA
jgi:endoglucanase Acf2